VNVRGLYCVCALLIAGPAARGAPTYTVVDLGRTQTSGSRRANGVCIGADGAPRPVGIGLNPPAGQNAFLWSSSASIADDIKGDGNLFHRPSLLGGRAQIKGDGNLF
jgi:hypothetical protein